MALLYLYLLVITLTVTFAQRKKEKDVAPIRYFGILMDSVNETVKSPNQQPVVFRHDTRHFTTVLKMEVQRFISVTLMSLISTTAGKRLVKKGG
jgi:hypothetical protein